MSKHKEQNDRREATAEQRGGRTTAEWVTLVVSLLIAMTVIGLLVYDLLAGRSGPPLIDIRPDYTAVRQEQQVYYLPVTVINQGGQTAEDVTIHFVLQKEDGSSESSTLTFRFMAPGERANATLLFNANPATGTLTHTTNYLQP